MTAWDEWKKLHAEFINCMYAPFQTKQLAEHLGVSRRLIEGWMKGKGKPKDEYIEKIAAYLVEAKKCINEDGKISEEKD